VELNAFGVMAVLSVALIFGVHRSVEFSGSGLPVAAGDLRLKLGLAGEGSNGTEDLVSKRLSVALFIIASHAWRL